MSDPSERDLIEARLLMGDPVEAANEVIRKAADKRGVLYEWLRKMLVENRLWFSGAVYHYTHPTDVHRRIVFELEDPAIEAAKTIQKYQ